MANVHLSRSFMAAATNSMFNSSEWEPFGEKYSLKDIWSVTNPDLYNQIVGDTAEIIATEFGDGNVGLRIAIPFKDGTRLELKLSGRSTLEEGDTVKIDSIVGQELHKLGSKPIVRYDAEKTE